MTLSFITRWRDELPGFYTSLSPTPLSHARLLWHNAALAETMGIDPALFAPEEGAGVWGGETLLPGMSPLSQVYSGHQFGVWAGQLGDGRGILLGEQRCLMAQRWTGTLKAPGLRPIPAWVMVALFCVQPFVKAWLLRQCIIWGSQRRVRFQLLPATRLFIAKASNRGQ
jgi:hypothetical protein